MPRHYTYSKGIVYRNTLHSAITADVLVADAVPAVVAGARAIGVMFKENGTVNNRSGVLTLWGSMDGGTTYVQLNMLISNEANTHSENLERVSSVTRAAAGADLIFLEELVAASLTHLKAQVDITDGSTPTGSFTVEAVITY